MKTLHKFQSLILSIFLVGHIFANEAGEKVTYYHHDHLGSVVIATDESGNLEWKREYEAYGKPTYNGDKSVIGYTGHEHVGESGLTYMKARWYEPELGRFMSPDPVQHQPGNPTSFNRYAYANNSPYANVDPDGRISKWITKPLRKKIRKYWEITPSGTSKVMKHKKHGKFYQSSSDGTWWSKDNAKHGGSQWKVFKQEGKELKWIADADEYGDFIPDKHKGDVGKTIPMGELSGATMGDHAISTLGSAALVSLTVLDAIDVTNWLSSGDSYLMPDGSVGSYEDFVAATENSTEESVGESDDN